MKNYSIIICLAMLSMFSLTAQGKKNTADFYSFKSTTLEGKEIKMKTYEGKVVLIVNTASKCGFTPQYEGLEKLYNTYKDKGLVILGFPCNQFASQEPGSAEEISKFCTLKYGVTFPMFMKIEVNGKDADPLYKYLKAALPGTITNDIKWNFTKFLLDKNGKPFKRYASAVKPEEISSDIEKLLSEN
jgi:glutathione peroxidase